MSDLSEQGRIAVTRSYKGKDGSRVQFAVRVPYAAEIAQGNYKCDYVVELGARRIARTVEGMDGLHAFFLSLSSIRRWITQADIVDPLMFRWEGADEWGDLGFAMPD
ncbi:hypothetical protein [Sphingomonas sp. SCN 67-18]|uniref:DUF6968 family protein n=1 Tax=uncultured Sphingomonas sp. TaxID=158754 RepID=UPI0025E1AFFB|nr:hypothetical protein [Sphingomonas sp. SCN 67-18]